MTSKPIETPFVESPMETITVDFIEFDEIREFMRNWIKDYRTKHRYRGGGCWVNSAFYVGRSTTSVVVSEINLPYLAITRLLHAVRNKFTEYSAYQNGHNIRVYLR